MTNIKYTLLAEGVLENSFIPEFLNKAYPNKAKFIKSTLNIKSSSASSRSKVLKKLSDLITTALIVNKEDLFIVGIDLDKADHNLEEHNREEADLKRKIPTYIDAAKVIIYIPIQAFDHWLLYQKYRIDGSKRPADNSLESKNSNILKKELYGSTRPNTYLIKQTAGKILNAFSADDLSKQSKSFAHFYEQIKAYLKTKGVIVKKV